MSKNLSGIGDIITANGSQKRELAMGALSWLGTYWLWSGIFQILSVPFTNWKLRGFYKQVDNGEINYQINYDLD